MDYLKPEVLITPATLQIQCPEKQKNTSLNPLGILMLLWFDGGLSTATQTHTQQHKGNFIVFVARKDVTIRLCAETMLQLKPQTKAQTEHMLFVCPYASTEISYSP
jgi:agmatine/peptidylarginine deiminase